ncbi:proton-conducting transporter membrane subunit, partial [Acidobacteriota bacterium]
MESILSIKPLLALLVSLGVVPLILTSRTANIRDAWSLIAGLVKFGIIASMVPHVMAGGTIEYTLAEVLPALPIKLRVDAMGLMFALVSSFLWIVTTAYAIGYMRALKEHSQTRFYSFFALSMTATIGVAFAANLLTLYLFYEMLSLSTYPLVTHLQDKESRISGRKYLTFLLGSSIGFLLPAMIMTYTMTGTLDFSGGGVFADTVSHSVILVLLLLYVYGFAKAAIMPLHAWLPAAMVAPVPVSALLHAVAVVKVGVFCI